MGKMMEGIHGGDIYRNRVEIDFSVNINPLGTPAAAKKALEEAAADCGRYPDITAGRLKKAVGKMLGMPEEYLLFGNGASELFMACVHGIRPKKTVIPVPSFYGYEYAAGAWGGETVFYEMKEEAGFCPGKGLFAMLTEEVDLLFLANPGNPAGSLMKKEYLEELLERCRAYGIYVVLDECFIEFCAQNPSMLKGVERFPNMIMVRAFTKIFAIPGVRLGYLLCSDRTIREKIGRQLPEWNISVFAQKAGWACAKEEEFLKETVGYVEKERLFLAIGLTRLGIRVISGEANFLLVYSEKDLYGILLGEGILIRNCRNFRGLSEGFYRIAVRTREENERLLDIAGLCLKEKREKWVR